MASNIISIIINVIVDTDYLLYLYLPLYHSRLLAMSVDTHRCRHQLQHLRVLDYITINNRMLFQNMCCLLC
jgi:hypothetical protein